MFLSCSFSLWEKVRMRDLFFRKYNKLIGLTLKTYRIKAKMLLRAPAKQSHNSLLTKEIAPSKTTRCQLFEAFLHECDTFLKQTRMWMISTNPSMSSSKRASSKPTAPTRTAKSSIYSPIRPTTYRKSTT